jgi:hypothetical protein
VERISTSYYWVDIGRGSMGNCRVSLATRSCNLPNESRDNSWGSDLSGHRLGTPPDISNKPFRPVKNKHFQYYFSQYRESFFDERGAKSVSDRNSFKISNENDVNNQLPILARQIAVHEYKHPPLHTFVGINFAT